MTNLSPHATRKEMACPCCDKLPEQGFHSNLLSIFEWLRRKIGHPISITSGYRCDIHNENIGGSSLSDHKWGWAIDIWPIMSGNRLTIINKVMTIMVNCPYPYRIGIYSDKDCVHIGAVKRPGFPDEFRV